MTSWHKDADLIDKGIIVKNLFAKRDWLAENHNGIYSSIVGLFIGIGLVGFIFFAERGLREFAVLSFLVSFAALVEIMYTSVRHKRERQAQWDEVYAAVVESRRLREQDKDTMPAVK